MSDTTPKLLNREQMLALEPMINDIGVSGSGSWIVHRDLARADVRSLLRTALHYEAKAAPSVSETVTDAGLSDALFREADNLQDYGNEASEMTQRVLTDSVVRLRDIATRLRHDRTTPAGKRLHSNSQGDE